MPKKNFSEEDIISDYGNWNVAADYSRLKIMKQLYLADEYETIATFGFSDLLDELNIETNVDVLKIRGFRRLIKSLIMVIDNSIFAVKGTHKEDLVKLRKKLNRYWDVLPKLFTYQVNQKIKTKELKIKPEEYDLALTGVIEIKSEINAPLNRYDLIFTHKEEFDAAAAKAALKKRLTEVG